MQYFLCFPYFAQLLISTIYISDNLVFPAVSPSNVILKMCVEEKKFKPKPVTMQNCGTKSQPTHLPHNSYYQGSGIIKEEEMEKIFKSQRYRELARTQCLLAMSEAPPTKSHHHRGPNMSWTRRSPTQQPMWRGRKSQTHNLQATTECCKLGK